MKCDICGELHPLDECYNNNYFIYARIAYRDIE